MLIVGIIGDGLANTPPLSTEKVQRFVLNTHRVNMIREQQKGKTRTTSLHRVTKERTTLHNTQKRRHSTPTTDIHPFPESILKTLHEIVAETSGYPDVDRKTKHT